jgi:hypothetical protein
MKTEARAIGLQRLGIRRCRAAAPRRSPAAFQIITVALAAMLFTPAAVAQRATQPYAAGDFRLGAFLRDLRQIEGLAPSAGGDQRFVCSNDPAGPGVDKMKPSPDLVGAGAIKCGVLLFRPGEDEPVIGSLEFFGGRSECEFLFYRRADEADYRLAQITLAMDNQRFSDVISLFRRAYGQATGFDVNSITTMFGAQLPNATYVWDNRISTIRLDMYSVTIERMSITFVHNELWDEFGAKLRRITAPR